MQLAPTEPAPTEAGAMGPGLRAVAEDSDVIVALIRTAYIIAFMVFFTKNYLTRETIPLHVDWVMLLAGAYTVTCFALYLRGYSLHGQRPFALFLDLLLLTITITTLRLHSQPLGMRLGLDLFGLYYLVLIAAAVWYRLYGAAAVSVGAVALTALSLHYFPDPYYTPLSFLRSAHPPLLLLIAVIAGYLMRARDTEHMAIIELRQEMLLARALQSRMLPQSLPRIEGYELGLVFNPARQVGGDFYDLRLLDDDHLLIVLADMAGKSVYGLVHLSLVYSHLEAAANEGHGPAQIAREVNRRTFAALQPEAYAAVFIGVLRLSDGLLDFANCGHMPPVRVRGRGNPEPDLLATGGIVIGALPEVAYGERSVTLAPGDALVCFSDGITDARNRSKELFGEDRVAALAQEQRERPAQEVAENLWAAVEAHASSSGQDDETIIVIRRLEG